MVPEVGRWGFRGAGLCAAGGRGGKSSHGFELTTHIPAQTIFADCGYWRIEIYRPVDLRPSESQPFVLRRAAKPSSAIPTTKYGRLVPRQSLSTARLPRCSKTLSPFLQRFREQLQNSGLEPVRTQHSTVLTCHRRHTRAVKAAQRSPAAMTGSEPARAMAIPVSGDGANMQNLRKCDCA